MGHFSLRACISCSRAQNTTAPPGAAATMESHLKTDVASVPMDSFEIKGAIVVTTFIVRHPQLVADRNSLLDAMRSQVDPSSGNGKDVDKMNCELKYSKLLIQATNFKGPRCCWKECQNAARFRTTCEHKDLFCGHCHSKKKLFCPSDSSCDWDYSFYAITME